MKKNKKLSLRLGFMAGLVSISLLGTTAGSLAWYAYSHNVSFSYVGTSVSSSSILSIGLIDDEFYFNANDLNLYNLKREAVTKGTKTYSVVFAQSRSGFSLTALRKYLTDSPYAVDKLRPVTTKERAIDATGDLELWTSPEFSETSFTTRADTSEYVNLPFVFKIGSDSIASIQNKNVWITDAVVTAQQGIEDSVRVYVDGNNKFLMKPADDENRTGSTKVGGLLDLDGDGFYDYNSSLNTEYCYGSFGASPEMSNTGYPNDAEHAVLDDINGTGKNVGSTFLAKHLPGIYTASFPNPGPKIAEYYAYGKVKPGYDNEGNFVSDSSGGISIATTDSNGIAFATLTIFIEGWDHSVIDTAAGYEFNLGLRFEVDRA